MLGWWPDKKIINSFKQLTAADEELLKKAWNLARHLHAGQKRKSGQPYFTHPVAVAEILAEKFADPVLTAAALLHDTVEDCPDCLMGDIYRDFGTQVGFLVDSVTKDRSNFYCQGQEFDDDIERLLWAGGQDVRCLLLKIADRQHNLNTISHLPNNKQIRMAFETQAILLPTKEILGYDRSGVTVAKAIANWQAFLRRGHFKNLVQLKDDLYKKQFIDLDCEMYDLVYSHTNAIIWQMTDKKLFEKMLADQLFNKTAEILSITSDGRNFRAEFQFSQGYTANPDLGVQLGISKFRV
ncbi:MAG TPA: HD domain-containing protein [bacterium]|jgi:(p)ppGpp synthase/HD superfamily hydrolase|nr:HD domain-containing protein [bacterium]HOF79456.1 HD domain-containing protein [bacterium]HOH85273.1 HD domain-containing protein [bacterium]HOQ91832.1 HD domain-containing protein [bacterium]HPL22399.1 HD domain-containing protein [bacterium]